MIDLQPLVDFFVSLFGFGWLIDLFAALAVFAPIAGG